MASLEIVLDEPTRTYVTGDTVKGNVVVTRFDSHIHYVQKNHQGLAQVDRIKDMRNLSISIGWHHKRPKVGWTFQPTRALTIDMYTLLSLSCRVSPCPHRDTGFAGGSAALKFTSFKLTCTSELVLRPHTGLIEMIANTGGPNNVTLMHEEVDFTRGGSIVSIDSSGSDQMSSDVGAPRVKGKAAYFPFEVALQPADNVRNGLLDSFHGKTIGIGTESEIHMLAR